jgi:hypothetical protein
VCFRFFVGIRYQKDYAVPLVNLKQKRAAIAKLSIIRACTQLGIVALERSAVITAATPHCILNDFDNSLALRPLWVWYTKRVAIETAVN